MLKSLDCYKTIFTLLITIKFEVYTILFAAPFEYRTILIRQFYFTKCLETNLSKLLHLVFGSTNLILNLYYCLNYFYFILLYKLIF